MNIANNFFLDYRKNEEKERENLQGDSDEDWQRERTDSYTTENGTEAPSTRQKY